MRVADIPRTKESEFYGPPWEERGLEPPPALLAD